jgi:hypothetical protein
MQILTTKGLLFMDMKTKVKNELKGFFLSQGYTLDKVAQLITEKSERTESLQNLSQKLSRGSIKYIEVLEILDAMGFKVEFTKK